MIRRWTREDFNRPTLRVARDLLGKFLVRADGLAGMISETEAYKGPADLACHAAKGRRTARVEPLYMEGGTAYVYLCYGIHWLFNVSSAGAEKPEAVLVRGGVVDGKRFDGPGRFTQALGLDGGFNREDLPTSSRLWIEDRGVKARDVLRGPRIGIDYAGAYWAARPWRFWIRQER